MADERPVIISCDGHATGRPDDYIPYIDPGYRERYTEFAVGVKAQRAAARPLIGRRPRFVVVTPLSLTNRSSAASR